MGQYDLFRKITQSNLSVKQRDVNLMKSDLISDFEDTPSFYNVLIEGVSKGIHIINTIKPEEKKIFSKPDESFGVGNIIDWNSGKWLVTKLDADNQVQAKGVMFECNNSLSYFSNENSILYEIPMVIESNVRLYQLGINDNKYLSIPSTNIIARIPDTSITRQIKRNDIYKIGLQSYKITDISDVIETGLLILKMEFCVEDAETHLFTVEILNGSSISTTVGTNIQLNCVVKNNGIIVNPTPPLTFISSNALVSTVSSSGLVTPIINGTATISVKLTSDLTVVDTISVVVNSTPVVNKTVQISGSTSIIKGYTENYGCVFKNNGIVYSDTSTFSLTADDGISSTSLAQITTQSGSANTCTISGIGLGYVKLFVRNADSSVVSEAYRIKVENLF